MFQIQYKNVQSNKINCVQNIKIKSKITHYAGKLVILLLIMKETILI